MFQIIALKVFPLIGLFENHICHAPTIVAATLGAVVGHSRMGVIPSEVAGIGRMEIRASPVVRADGNFTSARNGRNRSA